MTLIGKVKSNTDVAYNDEVDDGARGLVDGDVLPDITFTTADPPPHSEASEHGPRSATPTPTNPMAKPNYQTSTQGSGKSSRRRTTQHSAPNAPYIAPSYAKL
jgi:hypothetical protein